MGQVNTSPKAQAKTTVKPTAKEQVETAPKKRLNYDGIRQAGGKWYCKKDGYKKPFNTADECAEHFNGERKDGKAF